ncbi:MAG TPA: hypothetical protein ENN12_04180 [Epsilonproteobacteria bacterium]|nr:hypothetical protein [Campylobacterota bacterium]
MTASKTQALELIAQSIISIFETIKLDILKSVNMVCAKDFYATNDLPRFDHSAMDGYGVFLEDEGGVVSVQESWYAGTKEVPSLKKGHAIRIS